MGKIVILDIVEGSFEKGYIVRLRIETEGDRRWIGNARGNLPPRPEILQQYTDWQSPYRARVAPMRSYSRLNVSKPLNISISEIKKASKQLESSVNEWLESVEMREVKEALLYHLTDKREEIRFIIQTEESKLQQLPWHSWRVLKKKYVNAEVGLYLPVEKRILASPRDRVKVLAVFGKQESVGNNTRIRTEKDWEMLERHLSQESNAELIRLDEPTLEELCDRIEQERPQIIFFAGHSSTEEDEASTEEDEAVGLIELNQDESITIEDLATELKKAVDGGLQLAIFNSCQGLGIARQLADFYIPNIIVMREPVPDEVAQKFLEGFLEAFAAGKLLPVAVRKAREKLNRLERKFPGSTWLPMLFQNPAEAPLTWQGLGGVEVQRQYEQVPKRSQQLEIVNQSYIEPEQQSLSTEHSGSITCDTCGYINSAELRVCEACLSILKPEPEEQSALTEQNTPIFCGLCGYQNIAGATFCVNCGKFMRPWQQSLLTGDDTQIAGGNTQTNAAAPTRVATRISGTGSTSIGQILAGRYRIINRLGQGGFSITYLAEDMQRPGNPRCVVKQLNTLANDPATMQIVRRLFNTEAKVMEQLSRHDQIPTLLAYFEENQEFYLVQEFIEGDDLTQELTPGKCLSEERVVALLQNVLKILEFVHKQDVIHRDIKPSNLIRRKQDGKLVLIDFGAVKEISQQMVNSQGKMGSSIRIGTPGYMPAEQMNGHPRFNSDTYALGMIAIQALTGLRPINIPIGPNGEMSWRDRAQVSPQLAKIIDKMVCYNYRDRYQSATDVLQDLGISIQPIAQTIIWNNSVGYPTKRFNFKLAIIAGLIAASVLSILLIIGALKTQNTKEPIHENPSPAREEKKLDAPFTP